VEIPSVSHLSVDLVPDDCCAVIRLDGEVDIASVDLVLDATHRAVALEAIEHLVFDCRQLGFLDSSGVKTLLEAHRAFDGRVALLGPKRAVTRILELTGIDTLFHVVDSIEEAEDIFHEAS
jgi:anti-sigma B factor antagonist